MVVVGVGSTATCLRPPWHPHPLHHHQEVPTITLQQQQQPWQQHHQVEVEHKEEHQEHQEEEGEVPPAPRAAAEEAAEEEEGVASAPLMAPRRCVGSGPTWRTPLPCMPTYSTWHSTLRRI